MLLRKLNQPLTIKAALSAMGLLLLGAALVFGGRTLFHWLDSGPKSPRQIKRQIWSFLKKQAGRSDFHKPAYDFDLKQRVAQMQTNLTRFRQETAVLQTNLATATLELRKWRGEGQKLQEQQRAFSLEARRCEETLQQRQLRWTNLLNALSLAQSNALRADTNLAASSQAADTLQTATQEFTNLISGLLTNIAEQTALGAGARTNLAALKKDLNARQQDLQTARRNLADKRAEVAERQRALEGARNSLGAAQTNAATAQTNVAALQGELAAKRAVLQAKQQEVEANAAAVAAGQKEVSRLQEQLQARRKELPERQRALQTAEQHLRTQLASFRTDTRQKVGQASSYENMYNLIGQQLYVSDRLLASRDPVEQQQGLSMAFDASQHALQGAEQAWLAARICEAYLLPNLALADEKGRTGYSPDSLLAQCQTAFGQAEDFPNLVRGLRLSLDRALTNAPARADGVRYNLGFALERAGQYDPALDLYRQIKDTNYLRYADQRIAVVHALKEEKKAQNPGR